MRFPLKPGSTSTPGWIRARLSLIPIRDFSDAVTSTQLLSGALPPSDYRPGVPRRHMSSRIQSRTGAHNACPSKQVQAPVPHRGKHAVRTSVALGGTDRRAVVLLGVPAFGAMAIV